MTNNRENGSEIERRFYTGEVRTVEVDGKRKIVGYAAVFNQASDNLGGFVETIEPGAFSEVIDDDVRGLINHDPNMLLGRTTSGTLMLMEDDTGLRYEIDPPDTQYAKDLLISINRGDLNQSSFGFRVLDETWEQEAGEIPTRRLKKIAKLFDVSPVTFPAYPTTSAEARSKAREFQQHPDGGATAGHSPEQDKGQRTVGRLALKRRKLELAKKL